MKRQAVMLYFAGISGIAAAGAGWHVQTPQALPENDSVLVSLEQAMVPVAQAVLYGESDSVRIEACEDLTQMLQEALEREGSFRYPFDSLVTISRLFAPDSSFRIFTWNVPLNDGTYRYAGMIHCNDAKGPVILLRDRSDSLADLEHQVTGSQQWPGAHYYKIILGKSSGKTYYTLLGWDGYTRSTTRKIIEILTFDSEGRPVFGAPVFPDYRKGDQTRVIFAYSSHAIMSLKYELQSYTVQTNKNRYRPRYRSVTTRMIVFDHLEPMDPSVTGQYSFYIPVGNIFDAFVFKDGCWRFHGDVDARNPEIRDAQDPGKPIEYELFPPGEKK